MNPLQTIDNLIRMLEGTQTLFVEAQADMLTKREAWEYAKRALKEIRISETRYAEGKNAELREAWVESQVSVIECRNVEIAAELAFNAAYREYMLHKANLDYIRDMRALVQLRSDINPAF